MGRKDFDWLAVMALFITFLVCTAGVMNWSYATFVPVRERDKVKEAYDKRLDGIDLKLDRTEQKLDRIDEKIDELRKNLK